ncbi:MAG: hypothetical protein NKF70_09620 [Methanobacterium sp. ERen5]|nr:MAG: hypothetical protein NKF70_09620 [Methanobacterium sp. ERen5]
MKTTAPKTHFIPLILDAAIGRKKILKFGTDYETKASTCIQDYIHVTDLVDTHLKTWNTLKTEIKVIILI